MPRSSAPGAPLGPGSLLWRVASDWRSVLPGLSAGILQLSWNHLGQGVEDHSAFFTEPMDRINRSIPQIWGTIFADDGDPAGTAIRDLHRDIAGVDRRGERYHALDPDTFWWAHATFTWEMFQTIDRWDHGRLSRRRREQLYQETVTWYRRYGVSDRPVPPDHRAFEARFDQICREELELTVTAARAIELAQEAQPPPRAADAPLGPIVGQAFRLLSLGNLPRPVRRRFGVRWSAADEAAFAGLTLTVRNLGATIPHGWTRDRFLRSVSRMGDLAAPRP